MHELKASVERLFHFQVLAGQVDQHTGGRPLGLAGFTDLSPGFDVDVGDVLVLAKNGEVGEDIDGGDVGSDHDNTEVGRRAWLVREGMKLTLSCPCGRP